MRPNAGGYPIGTRTLSAMALKRRNDEYAHRAWLEQIPREPVELVRALTEAGVDLDELWRVIEQKRGSRR